MTTNRDDAVITDGQLCRIVEGPDTRRTIAITAGFIGFVAPYAVAWGCGFLTDWWQWVLMVGPADVISTLIYGAIAKR